MTTNLPGILTQLGKFLIDALIPTNSQIPSSLEAILSSDIFRKGRASRATSIIAIFGTSITLWRSVASLLTYSLLGLRRRSQRKLKSLESPAVRISTHRGVSCKFSKTIIKSDWRICTYQSGRWEIFYVPASPRQYSYKETYRNLSPEVLFPQKGETAQGPTYRLDTGWKSV